MQNNDLIPRKEVEKMIETSCFEDDRDQSDLLEKLSQVESVNGWIAVIELTGNIKCFFTDGNEYGVGYKFRDDYTGISFIPTHYMPLPPPPTPNKV